MKIPNSVLAIEMVKASNIMEDPRFQNAVTGGLMGAAGGGTIQLLRRLFQSRRDAEEEGEPSIMKGLLLGGLGGAGLGAGLTHLMRRRSGGGPELLPSITPERVQDEYGVPGYFTGHGDAGSFNYLNPTTLPGLNGRLPGPREIFNAGAGERMLATQGLPDDDMTWTPNYRLGDSLQKAAPAGYGARDPLELRMDVSAGYGARDPLELRMDGLAAGQI